MDATIISFTYLYLYLIVKFQVVYMNVFPVSVFDAALTAHRHLKEKMRKDFECLNVV